MSKFVIECPSCGKFAEAKTGFFAKKHIDCTCGHRIHIRTDKVTSRVCPHCGNNVVFDQSKGVEAKCPVCNGTINTAAEQSKRGDFTCARCGVRLNASKAAGTYTCPLCDHVNDVAERLKLEELKTEGFVGVIKYEGDNSTFIWKHPCEDFNTLTQLVVHESQEAIFFMNGQALDLFGPGRYTLETQNIPLLGKYINRTTGGNTPFHCEVYFINKTEQMNIKWGTDSKVEYMEPTYGFPLAIGASGEMSLRAEDSRKLLVKLVGTESSLTQQKLTAYFRAFLMSRVKPYIAQTMRVKSISIFEVDEHLTLFSDSIRNLLIPDFADYGISLERFFVTNVVKPEGDSQYKKFKDLHFRQYADIAEAKLRQQTDLIYAQTEAQKIIIDSQAQATKRAQEGYTYQQERGFDVASEVARNEAIGQFTNMGVGLGTMAGIGGVVAGTVGGAMNAALGQTVAIDASIHEMKCIKCGSKLLNGAKFCLECGEKVAAPVPDGTILCPSCGNTVTKGKFCPECGHRFITSCPKCGKELVPGAKFCLECGEKL